MSTTVLKHVSIDQGADVEKIKQTKYPLYWHVSLYI